MRILIDMNMSPQWCPVLEEHGHSCIHWSDVGDPRAQDEDLMEWALGNDYVVLTHDLDSGAILATTRACGPSVIQVRTQDVMPSAIGASLVGVLQKYEAELTDGALIVVDKSKSRVRVLPLST